MQKKNCFSWRGTMKVRSSFAFKFLLWVIFFLVPGWIGCQQAGLKYLKNYSRTDYDQQPQNWAILQDKRGIIYVGNNGCVLEFDGISWRSITVKDNRPVRSMAIGHNGTIYIGSSNEIGFLAHDKNGTLRYVSLRPYLPEDKIEFTHVRRTLTAKQGIYFTAREFLFRWDSRQLKVWTPRYGFDSSFVCGEAFFIRDGKRGLLQMIGESLVPVPGGETFADAEIFIMAPHEDIKKQFIATRTKGCYLYDGTHFYPFPTEVDGYLKEKELYRGIRLSCGNYALATLRGGLVIINAAGRLIHRFDKNNGLPDNDVKYVCEDIQGNLWLGLNYGISKIEYASPFSLYDEASQIPQMIISVVRHQENLYVGTGSGLYVMAPHSQKFHPVPGMESPCWSLLSTGDSLLAATSAGTMAIENPHPREIIADKSYVLLRTSKDENRTWLGTGEGLVSLYRVKGQWAREFTMSKNINLEIRTIVEDQTGNLWLGPSFVGGVLKIDFPAPGTEPRVTRYDSSSGLPGGEIRVFWAARHVMFATEKGIFRFHESKKRFIPDNTLGNTFTNENNPVFQVAEDRHKNIWVHSRSRNYQALPRQDGTYLIQSLPFLRLPRVQVNTIYPDGSTVWFGSNDNLIGFDTTSRKNYLRDFQALVRKVIVNGKSTVFNGNDKSVGHMESLSLIIPYRDRNLLFEFAAPFFEGEQPVRFRYFMEGYETGWCDWTSKTQENYTNLDAGIYTFRVQAQNIYGQLSREDTFRFRVLPPWYQTWWAFLVYGTVFSLLMYSTVRWRSWKLRQEKQKLEQTVIERTRELNGKNQQLEMQTVQLIEQAEKLQEMARIKSRFFANISHEFRTPLTLIMGPLENLLEKSSNCGPQEEKEIKVMLRNAQRLLTLINQLLDLARLDSGKMKLNAGHYDIIPFTRGILAAFEALALQNKIDLNFYAHRDSIFLSFDPGKIEAVLCNLIINAVKFTPPGGKVTVSVKQGREEKSDFPRGFIEVWVSDTGPGIPKDKLPYIFDRFYQAEDSLQRHQKGTGIGLALTKELVLLHQGNIDVHSSIGEEHGTGFVIRLPLGDRPPGTGEKEESPGTVPGCGKSMAIADQYIFENEEPGPVPAANQEEEESETPGKTIILVVEDNPEVRKYIRGSLEPHYSVVEAGDGREGLEKAKKMIPDLIISDIMMPEMDGYELCRTIKTEIKTSHIPVILLTAKASEESVIQGLETGADDYITKPFNSRILLSRIKNLVELRRQLQQRIQGQMLLQPVEISVSSMDREFIRELQEMIEKNLDDPEFNVEALSKKLYMNRATLYRKIMALTGETATEFIRSYRLKRAAQLLKGNFGNVTEVALEVGFSNMAYFTRCFKKKFHQLPSTYQAAESQ
jgi:signal transduction histidine kinase/DNA-binding response OmpR family regulator